MDISLTESIRCVSEPSAVMKQSVDKEGAEVNDFPIFLFQIYFFPVFLKIIRIHHNLQ